MNFNKILVAIDRSSQANLLFTHAISLAKQNSAAIHFFHCLEIQSGSSAIKIEREITEVKQLLADYQNLAKQEEIEVNFSCQVGNIGKTICHSARELQADLILLGRRGYRGLLAAIAGSVSSYVVNRAPCSVLVVQDLDRQIRVDSHKKIFNLNIFGG
ncbi:universal stress protein [Myxosarcina sp. GI1]|uniref:universal stress protein n=1 Tax=Myxosarcina sp. GI1 TaxID=1541065 RepID=UPI00068D6919|nr:universal stress protein [Myxosarcina sp. GI1]